MSEVWDGEGGWAWWQAGALDTFGPAHRRLSPEEDKGSTGILGSSAREPTLTHRRLKNIRKT